MSTSILVVEDEQDVAEMVSMHLRHAGFDPHIAEDGPGAIEKTRTEHPALVILDVMLPGMSGFEVCKLLRGDAVTSSIPILMLTARSSEEDRVHGLELGADDYLTKPYSPREMVLRVRSILRRFSAGGNLNAPVTIGPIQIDPARRSVLVRGRPVPLTATEFRLLWLLAGMRGRVMARDELLAEVWGSNPGVDLRAVDTLIRRLREKLGPAGDSIETVRGTGYRIPE